eukprot:XP_001702527.1 predicted protein [Chlamydomonas reinhardtii]
MAALPTPPCASAVRRLQRDLRQWALEKDELGIPALLQQLEPKDGLSRVAINMSPKVSAAKAPMCMLLYAFQRDRLICLEVTSLACG